MGIPAANQPPEMDKAIGQRIKQCRTAHKMSQTKLATAVGVAWQQIQKYEAGRNRVSASMLWRIGEVLSVPVSYFFDDLPEETGAENRKSPDLVEMSVENVAEIYAQLSEEDRGVIANLLKSVAETGKKREDAQ